MSLTHGLRLLPRGARILHEQFTISVDNHVQKTAALARMRRNAVVAAGLHIFSSSEQAGQLPDIGVAA
jgi:hypothetical protein